MTRKLPLIVRDTIDRVLERLELTSFEPEVRDRLKLFLDTWVRADLSHICDYDDGKITAGRLEDFIASDDRRRLARKRRKKKL